MGDLNVTVHPAAGIELADEVKHVSHHERQFRPHLKTLFREIRHMTFMRLPVTCEVPGPFDRYPVLLALLVHDGVEVSVPQRG